MADPGTCPVTETGVRNWDNPRQTRRSLISAHEQGRGSAIRCGPRHALIPSVSDFEMTLRFLNSWTTAALAASLLAGSGAPALAQPAWRSGAPIPVGTADGSGPLTAGLTSFPAGFAHVTGAAEPDLFAAAGRFSFPLGLFLYPARGRTAEGVPVFGERWTLDYPEKADQPPICTIVERDGAVHGFFLHGMEIIDTRFDRDRRAFVEQSRIPVPGLPHSPQAIAALPASGGGWRFVLSVPDGRGYAPPGAGSRSSEYVPFDGSGIWRGGIGRFHLWGFEPGQPARQLSGEGEGILWNAGRLTAAGGVLVSGSWFGDLYSYAIEPGPEFRLGPRRHLAGEDGVALRNPLAGVYPLLYPGAGAGSMDVIAGGEGGLVCYRATGQTDSLGRPVFRQPVPVIEENASLFAGTLPVPTIVDWDGDGVLDIVAGNSEGRILFFRNEGSNRKPAMAPGVAIHAGGREIHVQPGYKGDIQGPGEARWGYISPNVFDWNGDGLPDIVASDSTSRHYVYLNRGTKRAPKLDPERTLYLDGLDLHGTWRVRPGLARVGDRVAYIALDEQDQFHLYWRLDDHNLSDGGKLRLEDGRAITSNFLFAGGKGRSKFEIADWDGDGLLDLLVATPKHHSVPEPVTGLPWALGAPGTSVLWLKNTGTNEAPKYRFPVVLEHKSARIHLGHHEIGASVGELGPGSGRNLIVSREDGRLFFFQGENLGPVRPR